MRILIDSDRRKVCVVLNGVVMLTVEEDEHGLMVFLADNDLVQYHVETRFEGNGDILPERSEPDDGYGDWLYDQHRDELYLRNLNRALKEEPDGR